MIKQTLYPKTKRIADGTNNIVITEKIDGSNLTFFKYNNEMWIAQRNNMYSLKELKSGELPKNFAYKGLHGWLEEHGDDSEASLVDNASISGEWIGMGRIGYGERFEHKFLQFAKGNVNFDNLKYEMTRLNYKHDLFKYSFINQERPDYLGLVPVALTVSKVPTINELDDLYLAYSHNQPSDVEGFIIINADQTIKKYVRLKNGVLTEHKG